MAMVAGEAGTVDRRHHVHERRYLPYRLTEAELGPAAFPGQCVIE
jgi:hypothetical protein